MKDRRISFEVPGRETLVFAQLMLDFTGTLSKDGELLPGVAEQLESVAKHLQVMVLTADTFGTAESQLSGLPVEFRRVECGADKAAVVGAFDSRQVIAVGNGRNDVPMLERAGVGIAVIGPEGAAGELLRVADIVVCDVRDALDLVLNPLRLKATLRD